MDQREREIADLERSLRKANQKIELLEKSNESNRKVAILLIREFMYMCISWIHCLEIANGSKSWRARFKWFVTAQRRMPSTREELRQEIEKLKKQLIPPP